jgi:SpoIIAA-like
MAMHWAVVPGASILAVKAEGRITRRDIKDYLSSVKGDDVDRLAKVVLLANARLDLNHDDIEAVAQDLRTYCQKDAPGPMAFVVEDAFNLDMAVLLKQRVALAKFRVFADRAEAVDWVSHYDENASEAAAEPIRQSGRWRESDK